MRSTLRRAAAVLSACGLTIILFVYIDSLLGTTFNDLPWRLVLVFTAIAVNLPIYILERAWSTYESCWNGLVWRDFLERRWLQGSPNWALSLLQVAILIAVIHCVWWLLRGMSGDAAIRDGQFVLTDGVKIVRVLTQKEYTLHKAEDLRGFLAMMIPLYIVPMFYWWFRPTPPADRTTARLG
jgi:hypothetical protein